MPTKRRGAPILATSTLEVQSRLGDDADLVAAPFEEAGDEHGAEGRVVDVRVAGDDEDVELAPVARAHLFARGRQEARRVVIAKP